MKLSKTIFAIIFFCVLTVLVTTEIHNRRHNNAVIDEQTASQVVEPVIKLNHEHMRCLATGIYYESASEPYLGQVAVARVIMNRVAHGFGSNPCKVVYQTTKVADKEDPDIIKTLCQFSWVCEGLSNPPRNAAYIQAENIAKKVLLEDKYADLVPSNVLFFHNISVKPGWNYSPAMTIGNHIFYSRERKKNK